MPKILVINGSLQGTEGNTAELLTLARRCLSQRGAKIEEIELKKSRNFNDHHVLINEADGFLFGTGTYWGNWSSYLQKWLEDATPTECSDYWIGKPVSAIITMHSVGGTEVLSRLLGTLNLFGTLSPPLSGVVYSYANQVALTNNTTDLSIDLWNKEDIEVICHNLWICACLYAKEPPISKEFGSEWYTWKVDKIATHEKWIKSC